MQAFKVTTDTGRVYYTRADHEWRLRDRKGVVSVEPQEETPLVRASIIFDGYTAGPYDPASRDRIIARMADGECLWHACAQETGTRCHCAECAPATRAA
jgi:hypothetical protein